MLVDEDGVSVRVFEDDASRAGGCFVGFHGEGEAVGFEFLLDLADVGEVCYGLGVLGPTRVEGEDVLFEHALEEADDVVSIFEDHPVLRGVTVELGEA